MDDQRTNRESELSSGTVRRHKFRFSLKTLLLAMLLIAVYFAGRAKGIEEGFNDGYKDGRIAALARLDSREAILEMMKAASEPGK